MLIIGAKGFAKEVLEVLLKNNYSDEIFFFDDINKYKGGRLYNKFEILSSEKDVLSYFKKKNKFMLGVGNPSTRKLLFERFEKLGGIPTTLISKHSNIGSFEVNIGLGSCIMTGVVITNSINIGKGVLINLNVTIGHDSFIGNFSELCPGVHISGNCFIGENVFIGTGAVIIPQKKIGNNSIIAAGSIVTNDIPDNVMAAGVPAKIIKNL